MLIQHGVRIAQLVECWTHDQKVMGVIVILGRSSWRIFFSRVNFLNSGRLLFGLHSTPMLLQWHEAPVNLLEVQVAGYT